MLEINLGYKKLQKSILKFGYRFNYKYVGTISHSFDRFELPKVQDIQFTTIPYDKGCNHLDDAKFKGRYPLGLIDEVKEYCINIVPYIDYYTKQIKYYNQTAYDILANVIALI